MCRGALDSSAPAGAIARLGAGHDSEFSHVAVASQEPDGAQSFRLAGRFVLAGDDAPPVGPWGQAVFQPFEIKNRWSFERFRVSARAGEIV